MLKVRQEKIRNEFLLYPQAIFWRPINYFTRVPKRSYDDLDLYYYATYSMGNYINFEIRRYLGNDKNISILFLPSKFDLSEIILFTSEIIDSINLPKRAVAWRRGEDYIPGRLDRNKEDSMTESEAKILFIKAISSSSRKKLLIDEIMEKMPDLYQASDIDLREPESRSGQSKFFQMFRNVIAHRDEFSQELIKKDKNSYISLTDKGVRKLNEIGYIY